MPVRKPQITLYYRRTSSCAVTLHAMLRQCPGYAEACTSPRRVHWAIGHIMQMQEQILRHNLPSGCIGACLRLQEVIPFVPRLTRELTMYAICKIVTELAFYCAFVAEVTDVMVIELAVYLCDKYKSRKG